MQEPRTNVHDLWPLLPSSTETVLRGRNNNTGQTWRLPRDWRLLASWGANWGPPGHHSTIVSSGLREGPELGPHYVSQRNFSQSDGNRPAPNKPKYFCHKTEEFERVLAIAGKLTHLHAQYLAKYCHLFVYKCSSRCVNLRGIQWLGQACHILDWMFAAESSVSNLDKLDQTWIVITLHR